MKMGSDKQISGHFVLRPWEEVVIFEGGSVIVANDYRDIDAFRERLENAVQDGDHLVLFVPSPEKSEFDAIWANWISELLG